MHSRFGEHESGAVIVMVAVWLPLLAVMMTFGVDVGHWFDYKRNLQAQADAAALAAGSAYGSTCFLSGTPTTAALNALGYVAQQYTGADASSDLPYLYAAALPAGSTSYYNVSNLRKGDLSKFHVLLNSRNYWNEGGSNFSMTPDGTFCSSTDENGHKGAMLDIRLTQADLGLFFPIPFNFVPAINAHARVEIQKVGQSLSAAIGVRDPNAIPCISVDFVNGSTGNPIAPPVTLTQTSPGIWDNSGNPGGGDDVTMPAVNAAHGGSIVYVRPFLNNCLGSGDQYDSSSGILDINSFDNTTPALGDPPRVTTGGVGLAVAGGCNPDQYFTSATTTCTASVVANVAFTPDATNKTLTATDLGDATQAPIDMVNSPAGSNNWVMVGGFTVDPTTGQHPIQLDWSENSASYCTPPNKACSGTLGVQTQAFSACNGCAEPDSSGPIILAQIGEAGAGTLANAFRAGTTHKLIVTIKIQGLQDSQAGDPPIVLRYGTSTNSATGLLNCGQGMGASPAADQKAITFGCPLIGTPDCVDTDYCAPFKANERAGVCTPSLRLGSPTGPVDCVDTTGGTRASAIPSAIAARIVTAGICAPNKWSSTVKPGDIQSGDPRAVTVIVTSPADLSKSGIVIPIRNFATFYVTGWDTSGAIPNCNPPGTNEPYPGSTKKNAQKGAIWGHWIQFVPPGPGTGTGELCDPSTFGNCVAVLTR